MALLQSIKMAANKKGWAEETAVKKNLGNPPNFADLVREARESCVLVRFRVHGNNHPQLFSLERPALPKNVKVELRCCDTFEFQIPQKYAVSALSPDGRAMLQKLERQTASLFKWNDFKTASRKTSSVPLRVLYSSNRDRIYEGLQLWLKEQAPSVQIQRFQRFVKCHNPYLKMLLTVCRQIPDKINSIIQTSFPSISLYASPLRKGRMEGKILSCNLKAGTGVIQSFAGDESGGGRGRGRGRGKGRGRGRGRGDDF